MADKGGYDKNGKYVGTEKGAYTAPSAIFPGGRKVGYDEDDMKVGLSDTGRFLDDPRHMADEDAYIKMHPIGKPKNANGFQPFMHPGAIHDHLSNEHGGHRTESDVRYDIRHGYNIAKQRGTSASLLTAEDAGYAARKHIYIKREEDAKKAAAPADRSGERSDQFKAQAAKDAAPGGVFHEYETAPTQTKSLWDDSGMDEAPKAAPKSKSKPKNEDTLGGAIRHVIGSLRKKS
jgi:hypothetical protein